ncbi:MAG: ATP-binding protein [Lachnospiraceae bacterium]|nr:ATP-binding protein [Lachnospiraceae bacterium]MCD7766659.1 ATP-binding protein [Lachnospiraceae bacterium]
MARYLNPGNAGFESAVHSEIYVDKTLLLEFTNRVIGTEQRWLCVSRPRRFGKSITAGMLAAYYGKGCDSRELFRGKKISEKKDFEKHLNRYPVIHLDIQSFKRNGETAGQLLDRLNSDVISDLREAYPDTIALDEDYLPTALAIIHDRTGDSFFIILDEWDFIFREFKRDEKAQEAYIDLLRGLFKDEESKRFVKLAYLTGILPIKRYESQSALNNFREYTMTSPKVLAEYIGFTEDEVKTLCREYGMDFAETQRWYDGYAFPRAGHIYCPNSVANAMFDGEFGSYWSNTAAFSDLRSYICLDYDGLEEATVRLLSGEKCKVDIGSFQNDMTSMKRRDDVLTMLIHLGYLAYDNEQKEVYIPNEEVRRAFEIAVNDTDWNPVIETLADSEALLKATLACDAVKVAEGIEKAHMRNASILKYNDENTLRCVVRLAYYSAINEYVIFDEMPGGIGYADLVFLPRQHCKKPVLIIELKWEESAVGAIGQIKKRKYMDRLKEYSGKILLVGINYEKDDRDKKHTCVIEEWEK